SCAAVTRWSIPISSPRRRWPCRTKRRPRCWPGGQTCLPCGGLPEDRRTRPPLPPESAAPARECYPLLALRARDGFVRQSGAGPLSPPQSPLQSPGVAAPASPLLDRLKTASAELAHGLVQLLYPGACRACAQPLDPGDFCAACRTALTADPQPSCPRCAATVGPFASGCPR